MDRTDEILEKILKFREARDWEQFHNPKDMAMSLVLEASEVLEHFQWRNEAEIKEYVRAHKDDIGEELADTLYWVLLISHDLDINIFDAVHKKMEKNEAKYPVDKAKGKHAKYSEL